MSSLFVLTFHILPLFDNDRFKFDTAFEKELKREVFQIVNRGKEFATFGYLFRACSYLATYFYLQYLWLYGTGSSFVLAIAYGVIQALIGMNVQHDANHGAVSGKHPWMNNVLGLGADLIGGSKWLWMEQHWTHHAYTNHPTKDPDALSGEPIFLWTDYPLDHPKRQWHHRFQGIYYMFILSFYWISEVFNPQVFDLRQRGAMSTGIRMESDYCVNRRKYSTALRLYYIAVHVVAPVYQHGVYGLLHTLVLGFTESLTLAILFSLSHNFEGCDRDPLHATKRDENGQVCWFTAQVETSCTYGGTLAGYLTGGLNFQIEHHLFPRMSSAWYPYIAPTVRKVCQKHGVNYTYYPWVYQNWVSSFWYMCQTGTGANWRDGNPYSGKL
jgi:acyl-lipid (7-3)-desaturase (Delta-4 desaturase)